MKWYEMSLHRSNSIVQQEMCSSESSGHTGDRSDKFDPRRTGASLALIRLGPVYGYDPEIILFTVKKAINVSPVLTGFGVFLFWVGTIPRKAISCNTNIS